MEPTVYISSTPWYKRKILWIFLSFLILIPLGFYIFKTYFLKTPAQTLPQQSIPAPSEPTLKENSSPIAFDILQNPLVYEWRGSVEGTLVAKDDHTITISDNQNHSIVIPVIPSTDVIYGTKFYKRETKDKVDQFINIPHQDIPIGSKLRGDFFVAAREKDKIIGSSFEIIE